MDPTTGTFISMDSYSGSIYDPVSLHKYLYANANPVTYTDPTGYFSFTELMVTQKIQGVINSIQMSSGLFKVLRWVNAIVSVYDVFQQIKGFVEEGMSVEEIVVAMAKDCTIDALLDGLCSTKIGFILKPVLFVFSLGVQMKQLEYAWTEGTTMDKIMYTAQAIAMIFGLAQQCFTGDTLVWTENGTIAISEVAIGDEVYAYDAETGEAILAKVTDISVSETDELVHLTIDGELIRTTASHPFYTASGEWKAAGDLMVGDRVVTMTGEAMVEATEVEKLSEAVTVYNLTVEGEHNYYVAENGVLVHNSCGETGSTNDGADSVSRKQALSQIKDDLGIPKSQQPISQEMVMLRDSAGNPIVVDGGFVYSREMTYSVSGRYDAQGNPISYVVIQDHSYGHSYPDGVGNQSSHFNVRPETNVNTGKVEGLLEHYYFDYRNKK